MDSDPSWYPDIGPPEALEKRPGSILHLLKESVPYHERGYTMRSKYMLLSQKDVGFEPAVVTSLGFPRLDGFDDFPMVETIEQIEHHRLDLGPHYPYRGVPFDAALSNQTALAANVVRRVRPALLHANSGYRGYDTAAEAIALGRKFDIPTVYDVRSFLEATWTGDIDRAERGEHYARRFAREVACMRDADLVFTIAETMRADIADRGIDPERIVVIPNAVDAERFVPLAADQRLRSELGLDGCEVLGYISNLGHREGIDFLIRATAALRNRGRSVGCVIVGEGSEMEHLRQLVDELSAGQYVRLVGQVPHSEVHRYYSIIDVFVVPRRDDHAARLVTPLKPFEAMAMEKALLVADLPALVEVVEPGVRGLSFVAEDVDSLVTKAEILLDDPLLRGRLGREGRRWVAAERTWVANGKRYVEAYGRLGVKGTEQ